MSEQLEKAREACKIESCIGGNYAIAQCLLSIAESLDKIANPKKEIRCRKCNRVIKEEFWIHEGAPFHKACYNDWVSGK